MARWLLTAAVAVTLGMTAPTTFAQGSSEAPIVAQMTKDAEAAASIVDAFHLALGRNDAKAALALMADEAIIFEGGHAERSKSEYASHHVGADAAYASAVPSRLLRRSGVSDAGMASIISETRTTGRYKDKPVDRVSTETMVLRKTSDGWRIVHIHWSSRAAS